MKKKKKNPAKAKYFFELIEKMRTLVLISM